MKKIDVSDVRTQERLIYTAGFLFWKTSVLLVEKTHPKWQQGLWNAVGGKLHPGESLLQTQCREFREETGLSVPENSWDKFCMELGPGYVVHFYRTVAESRECPEVPPQNDTQEVLRWVQVEDLQGLRVVGNLRWLVPLAQDWRKLRVQLNTESDIRTRPTW